MKNTASILSILILLMANESVLIAQEMSVARRELIASVGEWYPDKSTFKTDIPEYENMPEMKMVTTLTANGFGVNRSMYFQNPEGKWMEIWKQFEVFDTLTNMSFYTGIIPSEGYAFKGEVSYTEDGTMKLIEYNMKSEKIMEATGSPVKDGASAMEFVYFMSPKDGSVTKEPVGSMTVVWKKKK